MKIDIKGFSGNLYNKLRVAGYHLDKFQRRGSISFSRSIYNTKYPRFHIYYSIEKKEMSIHLDQKAPLYKNAPDHGAEYNGAVLEEEVKRVRAYFN